MFITAVSVAFYQPAMAQEQKYFKNRKASNLNKPKYFKNGLTYFKLRDVRIIICFDVRARFTLRDHFGCYIRRLKLHDFSEKKVVVRHFEFASALLSLDPSL